MVFSITISTSSRSCIKRNLSGLFFVLDRLENEGLTLPHKIHFLLAKLGLVGLREAIWEKLSSCSREHALHRPRNAINPNIRPSPLDRRINLLKAVLQRDLSPEVDPLLSDLFEMHVGSENEIARTLLFKC